MKIKFWGVRGSIPSPGKSTSVYGGNTSCVEVSGSKGESLIIDSGTGIRQLGMDYLKRNNAPKTISLLVSHAHWDHIQGFPFFIPALTGTFAVNIYGLPCIEESMVQQMKPPCFPVDFRQLRSRIEFHILNHKVKNIAGFKVKTIALVHPQPVFGFRIEQDGKSLVYSSDAEYESGKEVDKFIKAVTGVDVLLYDAQYTPDEYKSGRQGWGHSTYISAANIAMKAKIKKLVLFHHDPTHDDAAIKKIERQAKKLFPDTVSAREGMTIEV